MPGVQLPLTLYLSARGPDATVRSAALEGHKEREREREREGGGRDRELRRILKIERECQGAEDLRRISCEEKTGEWPELPAWAERQ